MANWLERARCEIPRSAGWVTANSAERNPTAVTAVRKPSELEIPQVSIGSNGSAPTRGLTEIKAANEAAVSMTSGEESSIRAWLAHIEETDLDAIDEVLNRCRTNSDARDFFVCQAGDILRLPDFSDDRRRCDQCANLTARGLCLAVRRGEIATSRIYKPNRDLPHRCEGYAPGPDEHDRRTGRERWPGLVRNGHDNFAVIIFAASNF